MDGIGGFGALFDLKAAGFSDPVLVAATDGVGTKLRIAIETGEVAGVGTDLVAMCVNDLVCQGAEPLFFLDYFATARLDIDVAAEVVEGIAQGCLRAGAALIGGETAEMPGMYADGDFDLAGFAVGAMERGRGLPREIGEGDTLIAIASSGVHSNGFSLVRRVVEKSGLDWTADCPWGDGTLGQGLLTPTEIYVAAARAADATDQLRGLAHITGGGLTENLPRILPEGLGARVDLTLREVPSVFRWLAEQGGIDEAEMRRTFNCGIGMIAVAPSLAADSIVEAIRDVGHDAWVVGKVTGEEGIAFDGELF